MIVFAGIAWLAVAFTLVCLAATARVATRPPPPEPFLWPSLAVLRPCEGTEPALADRLASTLQAKYPGPLVQLVAYGERTSAIDALAVDPRVRLVASAPGPGPVNRKVSHLMAALAAAPVDATVIAAIDADVEVTSALLCALVAAVLRPGNVAAFAPPLQRGRALASYLGEAALGSGPHAFHALASLAQVRGATPPVVGCALAVRREALAAIGGFACAAQVIGDDLVLGQALGRRGGIEASAAIADCRDPTLGAFGLMRQLGRWIRVAVAHGPALLPSYPVLIAPVPLLLIGYSRALLAPLAVLYLARVALAALLRVRWIGHPWRAVGDPLVADAVWWAALFCAAWPAPTRWRGRAYAIGWAGRLRDSAPRIAP